MPKLECLFWGKGRGVGVCVRSPLLSCFGLSRKPNSRPRPEFTLSTFKSYLFSNIGVTFIVI